MRRDRRTDMTKLIVAFRRFAKAVIKKKSSDNGLYRAETSSLTDLHCVIVLTAFCEINISCFDCTSELYSFPETFKTLKRKKFTLQKICKIYISGNTKHIHASLEICMCVHGRMIKITWPIQYSESFVTFLLLFLAIQGQPYQHYYISLYRTTI